MNRQLMDKERLGAFIDAVIAIIMTILVLELEKPAVVSLAGFWEMRASFFAYALSFFWLGAMWVNLHYASHLISKISQNTVWSAMVMLFFTSLFPYATKLMSAYFNSGIVQGLYGGLVLCITAAVMWYYQTLHEANADHFIEEHLVRRTRWIRVDVSLKVLGLLISITCYPPAMSIMILVTLCVLVIPNQLR